MSGSRKSNAALGLPDGFKVFSSFPLKGMNQSASRTGMDDAEFYWLENLIKIGDGKLRSLGDVNTAFYTAAGGLSIVSFFWFNIGAQTFVAVFLSDGTAVQIAYNVASNTSGTVTAISSTASTFYASTTGQLPVCCQYGTQYLLIANNNTQNDYWIWDGSILYTAGTVAPALSTLLTDSGSGYSTVPSYTVFGGSGTGVTLAPTISDGSVVSLKVTNPGSGYVAGDVPQVAFSGGGTDSSAVLTAVRSTGSVEYVTLISGGSGYTNGTFALSFTGGGGGTRAAGMFTVTGGAVVGINLTAPGSGYVSTPTAVFTASAGGTGAAAVITITPSNIASITVVNGGSGFTGTPTLTITGGGGSGAIATANVTAGVISSVTVTNGGGGYTSDPTVIVQTGVNNAAAATLNLAPYGVSGTAMETYQQRVFLTFPNQVGSESNGGRMYVSAPGSLTDFATSDGGDVFTNTDRFLRQQFTFLRQTSNFLYLAGDSSVSVASNVQTSGNPATTTFSYQNTDPQTGTNWRDTAQDFGNTILFANVFGVWGIYGGSVRKVSKQVDDIFNNAIFPPTAGALTPTAAVVNFYSQKLYCLLLTITDPFTSLPRNVMLLWDQERWYVASQSPALTYLGTNEVNSDIDAWGTDGTSLYRLFYAPSSTLTKKISTKQWGGAQSFMVKMAHSFYLEAEDKSSGQAGLTFTGTVDGTGLAAVSANSVTNQIISAPSASVPFAKSLTFLAPNGLGSVYGLGAPQVPGIALGVTLTTTSPDFIVKNLTLGYIDYSGVA